MLRKTLILMLVAIALPIVSAGTGVRQLEAQSRFIAERYQ